jgi:predicted nucleic acid-binding protein
LTSEIKRKRAVFDTNLYVAAHKSRNPNSPTVELFKRWANSEFDLIYCELLIEEIKEKFFEKGITAETTVRLIGDLKTRGIEVDITPYDIESIIIADPDDGFIIVCAILGNATHIVTYDSHFDCLGGQYHGIKIVDGLEFLREVREI